MGDVSEKEAYRYRLVEDDQNHSEIETNTQTDINNTITSMSLLKEGTGIPTAESCNAEEGSLNEVSQRQVKSNDVRNESTQDKHDTGAVHEAQITQSEERGQLLGVLEVEREQEILDTIDIYPDQQNIGEKTPGSVTEYQRKCVTNKGCGEMSSNEEKHQQKRDRSGLPISLEQMQDTSELHKNISRKDLELSAHQDEMVGNLTRDLDQPQMEDEQLLPDDAELDQITVGRNNSKVPQQSETSDLVRHELQQTEIPSTQQNGQSKEINTEKCEQPAEDDEEEQQLQGKEVNHKEADTLKKVQRKPRGRNGVKVCHICNRGFYHEHKRDMHMQNHNKMVFRCPHPCGYMFTDFGFFRSHFLSNHKMKISSRDDYSKYLINSHESAVSVQGKKRHHNTNDENNCTIILDYKTKPTGSDKSCDQMAFQCPPPCGRQFHKFQYL